MPTTLRIGGRFIILMYRHKYTGFSPQISLSHTYPTNFPKFAYPTLNPTVWDRRLPKGGFFKAPVPLKPLLLTPDSFMAFYGLQSSPKPSYVLPKFCYFLGNESLLLGARHVSSPGNGPVRSKNQSCPKIPKKMWGHIGHVLLMF